MLSVCIPTYEMAGLGSQFLEQSLLILRQQTFQDFEVVVSDHSISDVIRDLCARFEAQLRLRYVRNARQRGNSPANTNHAMALARGRIIKILFQDDFLFGARALEATVAAFDLERDWWLVSASEHTRDGASFFWPLHPRYHDEIHLGSNTISSPSVLTIKNDDPLRFDENLVLRMDCDYYKRCHDAFGDPKILDTITVVNRVGDHQLSARMNSGRLKEMEYAYLLWKHRERDALARLVRYVAGRRVARLKRRIEGVLLGPQPRPVTSPHPETE